MDKRRLDPINISYDKDADVLYMSEGQPKEAICEMLDYGVVVRKDPETKRVVGFTIVDFITHFSRTIPQSIPLTAEFSIFQPA